MWQKIKDKFSGGSDSFGFALKGGLVLLGIVCVVCGIEWYAGWRGSHNYQSPIVFRLPWYELEPIVISPISGIPVKTEQETIEKYKLQPILDTVYFLESTAGKNDGCKDEGKFNGFGYRQHNSEWKCYDTFEEVVAVVNDWFEGRLGENGNNIMEAVCYYNTGVQNQLTCEYGQNFMSVIVDRL